MTHRLCRFFGLYSLVALGVFLAAVLVRGAAGQTPPPDAPGAAFYEQKVRPILAANCYRCHSHEAKKARGGLVVDSPGALLKGGDTGPAVVPGDPDKSLLLRAVRHADPDLTMPPGDKKLGEEQVAVLARWVKLGAPAPAGDKA